MALKQYLTLLAAAISVLQAKAQPADYPQGYFRNPLNIPISLAGNFGECRPNHFHSGMDIKTMGKENLPVHAAADGYISRIKMERGGFGHALYVMHPNGYTTLYAHLNDFMPAVQQYMVREQYKKESWQVDIQLEPSQFPVKKGQQIAWSGNTGGSTAPHLHFEIRDNKNEHPLNPQLFGFDIQDDVAPKPTQVVLYDLSRSIYLQAPKTVTVKGSGGSYIVADTLRLNSTKAGIGINVNDYMNGSSNTLNFYSAAVYMDDALQNEIRLDNIGYEETRYLHAYIDYNKRKTTGDWIQLLFRQPGNFLSSIYPTLAGEKGALEIGDGQAHRVRIELRDAAGNTSNISLYLAGSGSTAATCSGQPFGVNKGNKFEHPNVRFELEDKALYDDMCFAFTSKPSANAYSDQYSIHNPTVPVHTYFELGIKPNKPVPFDLRDKLVLVYGDGKDETGMAARQDDGWYKARVRNFGNYRLVADTQPPVLKAVQANNADLSKAGKIIFSASDAITSVKTFRAELDGKWLCFEQKGSQFIYTFDAHCPRGKHQLVVTASDENSNTQTLKYNFTR